jgi:hypothetical protein
MLSAAAMDGKTHILKLSTISRPGSNFGRKKNVTEAAVISIPKK